MYFDKEFFHDIFYIQTVLLILFEYKDIYRASMEFFLI